MFLNVLIIYGVKYCFNYTDAIYADVYTTMCVYTFTFAGLINLFIICQPLNKYRTVLFFSNFIVVSIIYVYAIINGFPALGLIKLLPFNTFWHHYLILFGLMIADVPLAYLLQFIIGKIKFKR